MATMFDSDTLPEPYDWSMDDDTPRTELIVYDGSLKKFTSSAIKRKWSLQWRAITTADKDTIWGHLTSNSEITFSPPDTATTYTVLPLGLPKIEHLNKPITHHNVTSVTLREV